MIEPRSHLKRISRPLPFDQESRHFKYRLDRNERNQPFSKGFLDRIAKKLNGEMLMAYPETGVVFDQIAKWLEIDRSQIMISNGSEQTIKLVFETYIEPGDEILLHFPGYAMYEVYGHLYKAKIRSQRFDENLELNWEEYINKITPDLRMVVLENPNGFLGLPVPLHIQKKILERAKRFDVLVLVDEAYFLFHNETVCDWVSQYDNLIVTRTFSKAFGLAGLRAGYLISDPCNIESLTKMKPSYEVTSLTGMILCDLIAHYDEVETYLKDTKENILSLRSELKKIGIISSDSRANFVAAKIGPPVIVDTLRQRLKKRDILIRRPFREPQLSHWTRISSSPPEVQTLVLRFLKEIKREYERPGNDNL